MGLQYTTEEEILERELETKKRSTAEKIHQLTGFDPGICQTCNKKHLVVVAELPRIRSPAASLPALLFSKVL